MDRNQTQTAGDYDLGQVAILGSSGNPVNITQLIQEINIFQNIDTPFITGNIIINDASAVSEFIPFLGQERLVFSLRTPGGIPLNFTDYHAVIYDVKRRFPGSARAQTLLLNFTTLECYRNIRKKVSKAFSNTISEIAFELLKSDEFLATKKSVFIDESSNVRNYISPNLRPYQVLKFLKEEAVTKEQQPYFVFFENSRGIHYRSIDSLMGGQGSSSVPHIRAYKYQPKAEHREIDENISTIINWEIINSNNTLTNGAAGMFASTLYTHDIYNKNLNKYSFNYIENIFKRRNSLNHDSKQYGPMISETKVDDENTITDFPDSKIFVHPECENANVSQNWLQESFSRNLEKQYFKIKLTVFGDTAVNCGDVISVQIPSNRQLLDGEGTAAYDSVLSGRYLITSLKHSINHPSQQHSMVIEAMKDSVVKQVPTVEVQYPVEPPKPSDYGLAIDRQNFVPSEKINKSIGNLRKFFNY